MIDLHCHILPNMDDGPDSIFSSLKMAEKAIDQGISHILCTPHYNSRFHNTKPKILPAVIEFQKVLDDKKIPLQVYEGQEVRLSLDLLPSIERDEILFVDTGNRYLLIEFPTKEVQFYAEEVVYDLKSLGIIPIIVHPERNLAFQKNPNDLQRFINLGCLAQITAPSVVGIFGKKAQQLSDYYFENNMAQIVSSDAHAIHQRSFYLKEAYQKLEKKFGLSKVTQMKEIARKLINGDELV